jgi:hypothetical protein
LLDALFSMWFLSYRRKQAINSSQDFLFLLSEILNLVLIVPFLLRLALFKCINFQTNFWGDICMENIQCIMRSSGQKAYFPTAYFQYYKSLLLMSYNADLQSDSKIQFILWHNWKRQPLLGNSSINMHPWQRIQTQRLKNCWNWCFLCGPCRGFIYIYCTMFRVFLHSDLPRVRVSATSNWSRRCLDNYALFGQRYQQL